MSPLDQAVRAAAGPLHVPGQADWQVIGPAQVEAIAAQQALPRWQVEVAALEAGVVPLRYMRNLARFAIRGQIELLRSTVTVVGHGSPIRKCLQLLAVHGVGRLRILTLMETGGKAPEHGGAAGRSPGRPPRELPSPTTLAAVVANQNASLETSVEALDLRRGDPAAMLGQPDVVLACVEDAAEEMLLQAACKRLRVPLVLGGLQEKRAQATTILPGDPGMALIYQGEHPHLDRRRPGSLQAESIAGMAVGSWLAEQVIALRLGLGDVLQNRLLYADISNGAIDTFPLGR